MSARIETFGRSDKRHATSIQVYVMPLEQKEPSGKPMSVNDEWRFTTEHVVCLSTLHTGTEVAWCRSALGLIASVARIRY